MVLWRTHRSHPVRATRSCFSTCRNLSTSANRPARSPPRERRHASPRARAAHDRRCCRTESPADAARSTLRQDPAGRCSHLPQRVAVGRPSSTARRPWRARRGKPSQASAAPNAPASRRRSAHVLAMARWISARWCRRRAGLPRSRALRTEGRNFRDWRRLLSSVSSAPSLRSGLAPALREKCAPRQSANARPLITATPRRNRRQ